MRMYWTDGKMPGAIRECIPIQKVINEIVFTWFGDRYIPDHRHGGCLSHSFAPSQQDRVCPASFAVMAVACSHAAMLCDARCKC
jgi:hypothetical protein